MLPRDTTGTAADPIADYLSEMRSRVQRGVCDCPDTRRLLAEVERLLSERVIRPETDRDKHVCADYKRCAHCSQCPICCDCHRE